MLQLIYYEIKKKNNYHDSILGAIMTQQGANNRDAKRNLVNFYAEF